jgi:hypothetical protein
LFAGKTERCYRAGVCRTVIHQPLHFRNEFQRNLSHAWAVLGFILQNQIHESGDPLSPSSQFAKRFRIVLFKVYLESSAISSCSHSGRQLPALRIIPPFPSQPKSIRQRWIFRSEFSAGRESAYFFSVFKSLT